MAKTAQEFTIAPTAASNVVIPPGPWCVDSVAMARKSNASPARSVLRWTPIWNGNSYSSLSWTDSCYCDDDPPSGTVSPIAIVSETKKEKKKEKNEIHFSPLLALIVGVRTHLALIASTERRPAHTENNTDFLLPLADSGAMDGCSRPFPSSGYRGSSVVFRERP